MTATAGAMDLSLKDAIEIALENNRDIKIEKENVVRQAGWKIDCPNLFAPAVDFVILFTPAQSIDSLDT